MPSPTRCILTCALFVSAFMPGCIAIGGTEKNEEPSLGRQLMDLKTARDNGAINQAEYDTAKARLLSDHK